jgi:hypothetical protein
MQSNHSPNSVQTGSAPAAQANNYGAPAALVWANTVIATLGAAAGIVALALVLIRLDDYADRLAIEKRLQTQAIDELRVEANVSRKLAGRPAVDSHSHD